MNETKYGVISDVHQDPRIVKFAIDRLKSEGIEKLLVNGDIGVHADSLEDSQQYTAFILDTIGKSGLESYVQPGSHETIGAYQPVIDFFADKYSNIVDVIKNPKVEFDSHHLAFLPGSDWSPGGEYTFGNQDGLPTGTYIQTTKGLVQVTGFNQFVEVLNDGKVAGIQGIMHYNNMNDLRTTVTQPEKTIVVCHVPRKFDNVDTGVDMAHFIDIYNINMKMASFRNDPKYSEMFFKSSGIFPARTAMGQNILKQSCSIPYSGKELTEDEIISFGTRYCLTNGQDIAELYVERKDNRGNTDLKNLYDELGITKAVSGHFHESSHRAHDRNGVLIPQNKLVDELYWNSGHLDAGYTGILTVKDGRVSYQNIVLK